MIGNVPVRPAAIGAVRSILAAGVPVVWVDHHTTRQNLLDEVDSLDRLTFLHDAELDTPPSTLAARVLGTEESHVNRLIEIGAGADSDDDWLSDCHALLCAQIGRCSPDILRRLALDGELSDEDRELIRAHHAREEAADELIERTEHPHLDIGGRALVVIDARGRDVGFLPRRVEARFGDVDLRVIVPDEQTVLLTAADRSRDLVRLLRSLPWPAGVYVGGRPHHARIDPGAAGVTAIMDILTDPRSWPSDIDAASARPPRESRRPRQRRRSCEDPPAWKPARPQLRERNFLERVAEQRFTADVTEEVWRSGGTVTVYRGDAARAGGALVLESGGCLRRVALVCTGDDESATHLPVPGDLTDLPDAAVVWAEVDAGRDRVKVTYRWFGDEPGSPLPRLESFPAAEDAAARLVPADEFAPVRSVPVLVDRLFGR